MKLYKRYLSVKDKDRKQQCNLFKDQRRITSVSDFIKSDDDYDDYHENKIDNISNDMKIPLSFVNIPFVKMLYRYLGNNEMSVVNYTFICRREI